MEVSYKEDFSFWDSKWPPWWLFCFEEVSCVKFKVKTLIQIFRVQHGGLDIFVVSDWEWPLCCEDIYCVHSTVKGSDSIWFKFGMDIIYDEDTSTNDFRIQNDRLERHFVLKRFLQIWYENMWSSDFRIQNGCCGAILFWKDCMFALYSEKLLCDMIQIQYGR